MSYGPAQARPGRIASKAGTRCASAGQTRYSKSDQSTSWVAESSSSQSGSSSAAGETHNARTEQATERVIDFASETTRRAATTARNGVSV